MRSKPRNTVAATYIDSSSPHAFRVCSAESAKDANSVEDTTLQWDYVAFANDVNFGDLNK
jgi:hypothetical protein